MLCRLALCIVDSKLRLINPINSSILLTLLNFYSGPSSSLSCDSAVPESVITEELSSLSPGQRKILIAVASGYTKGFTSKDFLKILNMTSSSVFEALQVLEQKDYIENNGGDYQLVDPLIKASL